MIKVNPRPVIRLEVYEVKGFWPVFQKYHYLSHALSTTAKEYVAFYNDKPIAFCAYIHFPHKQGVLRRIHRLVVLPDYQGLGIAKKLLNVSAKIESKKYHYVGITTGLKGFAKSLMNDDNWNYFHGGHLTPNSYNMYAHKSTSASRNTYSFRWIGGNGT